MLHIPLGSSGRRCFPALAAEDTPPPPPLLPPSCLLHAAAFRKRKREYWCVFRKVWTSLTFWNQRYKDPKQAMVSYRKYTRTSFATVKGISTTDGRSVQSFLDAATAVIPDLRLSVRAGIQQQHVHRENNTTFIDSRRLKEYSFFALQRPPTDKRKSVDWTDV